MFELKDMLITAISGYTLFLYMANHKLTKDNYELKLKVAYTKAIVEANTTKHTVFNDLNASIEREYNEKVTDINNTPVGGFIDFGMRP